MICGSAIFLFHPFPKRDESDQIIADMDALTDQVSLSKCLRLNQAGPYDIICFGFVPKYEGRSTL